MKMECPKNLFYDVKIVLHQKHKKTQQKKKKNLDQYLWLTQMQNLSIMHLRTRDM